MASHIRRVALGFSFTKPTFHLSIHPSIYLSILIHPIIQLSIDPSNKKNVEPESPSNDPSRVANPYLARLKKGACIAAWAANRDSNRRFSSLLEAPTTFWEGSFGWFQVFSPRSCLTPLFGYQPTNIRSSTIKTRVKQVLGMNTLENVAPRENTHYTS